MKLSTTTILAFYLALAAKSSAAPAEIDTAAAAANTGPNDLSPPHWKKPIPTFSFRAHRTLEAVRTLEARNTLMAGSSPTGASPTGSFSTSPSPTGPSPTAGPPVPGFPSDGELSWGVRPHVNIVTDIRPGRGAIM